MKGTRVSHVMWISEIHLCFGLEPTYIIKPIGRYGNSQTIGEEALDEIYVNITQFYNKIPTV